VVASGEPAGPFRGPGKPVRPAEDVARHNAMLAKRARELESGIARLEDENSKVRARKAEVDSRLMKLHTEHGLLRDRQAALETERNALKAMSARRAKAVKNVADRITGKLAVNAGGLIAEMPVRAAPYVGVFALVTGTALEIRSDCELARTLNGLVLEHQEAPLDTHAVCQYADRIPAPDQVWTAVKKQSGSMAASVYQTIETFYPNR